MYIINIPIERSRIRICRMTRLQLAQSAKYWWIAASYDIDIDAWQNPKYPRHGDFNQLSLIRKAC